MMRGAASILVAAWLAAGPAAGPQQKTPLAAETPMTADAAQAELNRLGLPFTEEWLIRSAAGGDLRAVKLYLTAGMSPNVRTLEDRETPVMKAAQGSHLDVLQVLLAAGARPDERDRSGGTALGEAVERRRVDVIRVLLSGGANPNLGSSGEPLLMGAVSQGDADVVAALLEGNADPNIANSYKVTPLMVAAEQGRVDLAEKLLRVGAKVNAKDSAGNPAIVVAVLRGYKEMVQLLIAAGADVKTQKKMLLEIADREGHKEVRQIIEKAAGGKGAAKSPRK